MNILKLAISVIILFCTTSTVNALTIPEYEKMKKDDIDILKLYLLGVGRGYTWSNILAKKEHNVSLFCPPNNLVLNGDNYISIIDMELEAENNFKDNFEVEVILLVTLQETFPCEE